MAAVLAGGALVAAAGIGSGWPREALDWQPARAWSEPWRWLTAAWVHLDRAHLLASLAGAAVVAAFGGAARCGTRDALAWACAWPMAHGGLLLAPQLQHVAGASGVLHAGVAVAAGRLLAGRGRGRTIGALVLAGLLLKLLAERPWVAPLQPMSGWDFPVAVAVHVSGVAAGLACAAVAWATSPRRAAATIA